MNDFLISMFIDNELDLDDKLTFVGRVHEDKSFKDETIDLLNQEKLIRSDAVASFPEVDIRVARKFHFPRLRDLVRPVSLVGSAIAVTLVVMFLLVSPPQDTGINVSHRFVIYRPDATRVELTGSFNEWQRISMEEVGNSGYWEMTITLPPGEHRFSYILEGDQKLTDPTVRIREKDDFGGENSVLVVEI
ncbi:MAG: glycogen-binding domain-containing protein [Deltaproteobacteria bacterium]|nr:glycogen-binding domain-containing protein [Deltaproteobacteria bacterium]